MVQINDVDTQRFSLNGVEYFKNFTPIVIGDRITIVNTYDSKIEIVPLTLYSDFEVDATTYASVILLQQALLPVIFTRDSLGVAGFKEILVTNSSVTGAYDIDWAKDIFALTLTGNTSLTESNLPGTGFGKTITLEVSGNFTLSYPADWTDFITGEYIGTAALNTIVVQYFGTGKYKVQITQPD